MMCLLGLVLKVPNEVFCLCLMIEYIIKSPIGLYRLHSGKWIHDITRIDEYKKRKGAALPLFHAHCQVFTARSRRISLSTGTLTHSDAATKNAMPTMRFTLICSWYTTTASAVARMGLTR